MTPEAGENPSGALVSDDGSIESAPSVAPEPTEVAAGPAPDPELVEAGKKVFRRCSACHQVGPDAENRVGPHLNGVVGRNHAAVAGFAYSEAMAAKAAEPWSPEELFAFLENPKQHLPGTKMAFAGLPKPEDRANVIAFLAANP